MKHFSPYLTLLYISWLSKLIFKYTVPILILRDCFYLKQALMGYVYHGKTK